MSDKADESARHLSDYCIYLVKGVDAGGDDDDGGGGRCGVSYRSEEVNDDGKGRTGRGRGEPG